MIISAIEANQLTDNTILDDPLCFKIIEYINNIIQSEISKKKYFCFISLNKMLEDDSQIYELAKKQGNNFFDTYLAVIDYYRSNGFVIDDLYSKEPYSRCLSWQDKESN